MSGKRQFVSGDEAVALAVRLIGPHVIAAYPITPQTIVVERLSDFVEEGSPKERVSCMWNRNIAPWLPAWVRVPLAPGPLRQLLPKGCCIWWNACTMPAAAVFPIVMMNANRSLAAPWSIFGDQRDSLSQLDCGWLQAYAEDAQEALDLTLQAYRIAEDPQVMTPVMVNLDGFVLTHTYEVVEVPEAAEVAAYLPPFDPAVRMDLDNPQSFGISVGPLWHTEFRLRQQQAALHGADVIRQDRHEFNRLFGPRPRRTDAGVPLRGCRGGVGDAG